ncbi:MAG: CDP-alcohol phosphatidyltransferase family protein [Flavobacteriales bacterium]|nr:CDP-alcohol phosphatidyltransferase family protein [Flavobacteriales bacterium]
MARLPRIPDLLTTANLACGVCSILLASQGQLTLACWLVFAGALFDVFDGLAARALGGGTPLGAQLDSLADMVTFGVAPGMLVWSVALPALEMGQVFSSAMHSLPPALPDATAYSHSTPAHPMNYWITLIAVLLIPISSAWRLAKFNIDTRQTSGFLGLPTPANALFWASVVLAISGIHNFIRTDWPMSIGSNAQAIDPSFRIDPELFYRLLISLPYALLGLSLVLGALMLSELPLPSLKFKHFKWKGNEVMFLLLGIGLVLVVLYGVLAVPLILVLYLLSPLWGRVFAKAL